MPILSSLLRWVMVKRMHQIDLFRKYPLDVQHDTFNQLIRTAQNTDWGKKYDYKTIPLGGTEIFKSRVPVQNYESLKPYIERLRDGEQNILWNTEIRWFAKSSGTTGDRSKFIPVSRESLENCHFRGGKDVLAIYNTNYPDIDMFMGKGLAVGGSHEISNINNESYFGDLSAILIQNMPFWAHFIRTPDISIALMDNWEAKVEKMAHATIDVNVTNIAGVPSWTMVLAKKILEITGKKNLLEVWPNLELFMHGGVSFEPYREQFKQLIPSEKMNYLETYNASEGFFAIQDNPSTTDLLLMLDYGIFYEFIPFSDINSSNPRTLSLDEVEIGKNYAVVISTNGGLWRYIIGDTVTFTSKYPYKIKITGRTKHFINAFGEEVIVDNAEKALTVACNQTGASIREYTAAPIYMTSTNKGGHQWIIEFETLPADFNTFCMVLDKTLMSINSDYEAKRKNINPPQIIKAHDGLFYEWLKRKGKLGGQHKIPRLSNHRKDIDELLELNHELELRD